MVEDEWTQDLGHAAARRTTLTYRAWNAGRKLWEIVSVVPADGRFDPRIA